MSDNWHWVCDGCGKGREEKSVGGLWPAAGRYCAECDKIITRREFGRLVERRGVVHHTLPISNVTACGLERAPRVGQANTYDFSRTTCAECRRALTDKIPDADVQAQMADAGWLRTQGEDFRSLRELVTAVNAAENLLVGSGKFKDGRAAFVKKVGEDFDRALHDPAIARAVLRAYDEKVARGQAARSAAPSVTPAGGLCHDDAATIVRHVRSAIGDLRAGQAWPDDARVVAKNLERTVESIVGKKDLEPVAYVTTWPCANNCGERLAEGATAGGLCAACQKGADVHRHGRGR